MIALAATIALGGVALAASTTTYTSKSTVRPAKGGTKKKPVPLALSMSWTQTGPNGERPTPTKGYSLTWTGLNENGGDFPTCTQEEIDAAQSDSVCPEGSLVGDGKLIGLAGSETDPVGGITCERQPKMYNAGDGKATLFLAGDPSQCAGIGYLPPVAMTWKNSGTSATLTFDVPPNITSPLPGIEGAISTFDLDIHKVTKQVKGKTRGYLQGVGCGGKKQRTFTFVVNEVKGEKVTQTSSAGKCTTPKKKGRN
jgi:hypothetical protein